MEFTSPSLTPWLTKYSLLSCPFHLITSLSFPSYYLPVLSILLHLPDLSILLRPCPFHLITSLTFPSYYLPVHSILLPPWPFHLITSLSFPSYYLPVLSILLPPCPFYLITSPQIVYQAPKGMLNRCLEEFNLRWVCATTSKALWASNKQMYRLVLSSFASTIASVSRSEARLGAGLLWRHTVDLTGCGRHLHDWLLYFLMRCSRSLPKIDMIVIPV